MFVFLLYLQLSAFIYNFSLYSDSNLVILHELYSQTLRFLLVIKSLLRGSFYIDTKRGIRTERVSADAPLFLLYS